VLDVSASVVVIMSALPNPEKAAEIARILVEERLAACVNLIPQIRSIYRWKDAISDETETLAVCKTTQDRAEALHARLIELHPYELPEVLALPVSGGHAPYLDWVGASVEPPA
jgi:periplasmic divalent cation tolerance protein